MFDNLFEMARQISKNRDEIIEKLLSFVQTDLMFFWGSEKDLIEQQEKLWRPLLEWASYEFDINYKITQSLDVPTVDASDELKMRAFLESLSDKELAGFYVAASNVKSILIAAALVKKRISAEEAFNAALLEEHWQAEVWGSVDEAESRQMEIRKELKLVEDFLK